MRRQKLVIVIVGVAAIAAVVWWKWPRGSGATGGGSGGAVALSGDRTGGAGGTSAASGSGSAAGAGAGSAAESGRVRRLSKEERRRLGEQIAAAAKRARTAGSGGSSSGSAGSAPDELPVIPLEQAKEELSKALHESASVVAECFDRYFNGSGSGGGSGSGSAAVKVAAAMMEMVSDPELGTVVDTGEITDADGKPIDRKLDDCVRDTIDSLALPSLGVPGKLKVKYTFRFE